MSPWGVCKSWMRKTELVLELLLLLGVCSGTPIGGPSGEYSSGVRCYDCNYSPTGYIQSPSGGWDQGYKEIGYQKCALMYPGDSDLVDKWVCSSGACFIRRDSNGLVYRGCADTENLPYDVRQALNCKYQGPKKSLWWFCEGDLCNHGQLGESEARCGSPPPPAGYELSSQGLEPEVPPPSLIQYDDTDSSSHDDYHWPELEKYPEPEISSTNLPYLINSHDEKSPFTEYDPLDTSSGRKPYPPSPTNSPSVPHAPFFYFTFPFYQRFLHPTKLWYGFPPHLARHYQVEYQAPRKSINVPNKSIHSLGYDEQPQDQGVGFMGHEAVYGREETLRVEGSMYIPPQPEKHQAPPFTPPVYNPTQKPSFTPPVYNTAQQAPFTPPVYDPAQQPPFTPPVYNPAQGPPFTPPVYNSGHLPPHYEEPYIPSGPPHREPAHENEPYPGLINEFPPSRLPGGGEETTEERDLEGYYENIEYYDDPDYTESLPKPVAGTGPCTGSCEDNPSGLYPDPGRRDHFIQCGLGEYQGVACTCCRPLYMQCSPDTVFDDGSKVCVRPGMPENYDYQYNEG